ncbi:MAG: NFYB/HAP3 family transcription factor subunit, partial [Methanomicrobium sp.]|nr:NFYB/HAP3 family transcription factor subunit [Methanomicrobium sp.]
AEALVAAAEAYVAKISAEANKLASHAGRKTIKKEDIDMVVKA